MQDEPSTPSTSVSLGRSTARRTIDLWEFGKFYGQHAVAGYIDGQYTIAIFRWWTSDRFGVAWSDQPWTQETLVVGRRKG